MRVENKKNGAMCQVRCGVDVKTETYGPLEQGGLEAPFSSKRSDLTLNSAWNLELGLSSPALLHTQTSLGQR